MKIILRLIYPVVMLTFSLLCYAENNYQFQNHVPPGWKVINSVTGDLNANSKDDAVLILEKNDPANYKSNSNLGPDTLNLNPRRLLILFKTTNGYKIFFSSDTLIPSANSEEEPCLADPLGSIEISKGLLIIQVEDFRSCGGWRTSTSQYIFRYINHQRDFRLIGRNYTEYIRNTGENTEYSWNYMTGKMKIKSANESENTKTKIIWQKIKDNKPLFLSQISRLDELQ